MIDKEYQANKTKETTLTKENCIREIVKIINRNLAEAESDYDALPIKAGHRIAEAYTVVRYKAVKV